VALPDSTSSRSYVLNEPWHCGHYSFATRGLSRHGLIHALYQFKAHVYSAMLARWKCVKHPEHYFVSFSMCLVQDSQDSIDPRCRYLFPRLVQPLGGIESHEPFRVALGTRALDSLDSLTSCPFPESLR